MNFMTMKRTLVQVIFALVLAFGVGTPARAQYVEYIHTDALGSPVAVTDANRVVIEHSDYEPYGKVINHPLHDEPGYAGHVSDAATGLSYMQQRYYDPQIGRFLSVDPVTAFKGGSQHFNRYAYAYNAPYKFNDPDGRSPIEIVFFAADVAELGGALSSGEGIGMAVANLAIDAVGVASPVPGISEVSHAIQTGVRAERAASEIYRGSKLARNMAEAGRGVIKGEQDAHHIVAQTDKRAAQARAILARNGIGVHSANNGAAVARAEHRVMHTAEYHREVGERLAGAEARGSDEISRQQNVSQELGKIRKEIEKPQ